MAITVGIKKNQLALFMKALLKELIKGATQIDTIAKNARQPLNVQLRSHFINGFEKINFESESNAKILDTISEIVGTEVSKKLYTELHQQIIHGAGKFLK